MSSDERREASAKARAILEQQASWQAAGCIFFYAPMETELDVWPLLEKALQQGKIVALPRFYPSTNGYVPCRVTDPAREVRLARYGIREPLSGKEIVALNRLDFALVPGVAFDLQGHRLGRGTGYYDALLVEMRGKTCGVAFDQQIVREVPVEPHDSDVNCILTPTRWIEL
jgi:5-formyltetrahydrofolate cyclo-ligase